MSNAVWKRSVILGVLSAASLTASARAVSAPAAPAEVPEDIYQALLKIGQIVDPSCTAKLYRPLQPANDYDSSATPLYPGITIARDQSFGPHPKDLADVFAADKGGGNRPVLIYVPGGGGNKIEQQVKEGHAFYDNIGRWATRNGMVGVLMQRHPGANWDDPAKDVSLLIQWLQSNVAKYQGNPDRMFIWAHSAGNGPVGTYLGRPELHTPKGVGVKGAILMSGQWNIAPLAPPAGAGRGAASGAAAPAPAGSTCGGPGPAGVDAPIVGPSAATPTAGRGAPPAGAAPPAAARGAAPQGGRGAADAETQLARSTLPELRKGNVALLFASAELDPGVTGAMSAFYQTLHDDLCKAGKAQCPAMLFGKRENHMSLVFSIDTKDTSISGPVLQWIRKVK